MDNLYIARLLEARQDWGACSAFTSAGVCIHGSRLCLTSKTDEKDLVPGLSETLGMVHHARASSNVS